MNKENLQKIASLNRVTPQELFDIREFRLGNKRTHVCNSVGCSIGRATELVPFKTLPLYGDGTIDFEGWSEKYTGLPVWGDEWDWCFSPDWHKVDNTPIGAALRIEWLINKGLPKDWFKQMNGEKPLCYK